MTSLLAYVAGGAWLALDHGVVLGDALARIANASYVVSSRDPHLAAVGFVWNPLPSLAMLPLIQLRAVAPALVEQGFAANLASALVMAGAVLQAHGLLRDVGLTRTTRLLMTATLALHPLVLFNGANGMSEAWLLLGLIWSTRRLVSWTRTGQLPDLVACAAGLALSYMCRYEAVAAAAAVPLLVAFHSWSTSPGPSGRRGRRSVGTDALLVALPVTVCFAGWALLSWIIVGHPFETFQSPYGNTAQVAVASEYIAQQTGGDDLAGRTSYVTAQIGWLAPSLAIVLPAALLASLRRRRRHLLAPVAVLGSVLAFQTAAFLHGDTFGWLRFSITAVPLTTLLIGLLAALSGPGRRRAVAAGAAVVLAGTGAVTAWHPVLDPMLGREESSVLLPLLVPARATAKDRATAVRFDNERAVARWLDRQGLPDGSVLVDAAPGFPIVLFSHRPHQFVINSDSDFEAALADPAVYDIKYVLAQPLAEHAVNRAYPGIYDNGAGSLTVLRTFPAGAVGYPWRVFAVGPHL